MQDQNRRARPSLSPTAMQTHTTTPETARDGRAPRYRVAWRAIGFLVAFALALNILLRPIASAQAGIRSSRAASTPTHAMPAAGIAAGRPCCHGVCHCAMGHTMPGMACRQSACPCSQHPRPTAVLHADGDQPYLMPASAVSAMPNGTGISFHRLHHETAASRAMYPPAPPPESLF